MPNEPFFALELENVWVDTRLSKEEVRTALKEIERLSFLRSPQADWTMKPVNATNKEWQAKAAERAF